MSLWYQKVISISQHMYRKLQNKSIHDEAIYNIRQNSLGLCCIERISRITLFEEKQT